jgi:peptidyl-prolyl cis-trans isomerase C
MGPFYLVLDSRGAPAIPLGLNSAHADILKGMKIFAFLLIAASSMAQQPPPAADPVVLTIGTDKITQSQFEMILGTLPEQARAQAKTPEGRRQLAEQLVELKILSKEAKARKLDQSPDVQARLTLESDQVLASVMFRSLGTSDEAAIHAYYDAHKSEMDQVHARHILIRFQGSAVPVRLGQKDLTDAEALQKAKDLRAKILAGAKFAEVAQAESDDVGSGTNGGDLDTFGRGAMVPEFEKAAFALPVGEVSEPVRSAFGYHLILVETHSAKSFDDARAEIEKSLGPKAAEQAVDDLKSKAGVVYSDTYFGK